MRLKARIIGLSCASIAVIALCGCSWEDFFPPHSPTLPNDVAVDRALRLCSLSEGNQPFHLVMDIAPPPRAAHTALGLEPRALNMRAQIEIYWLNRITYRTVIRSRDFNQIRIVNGNVVEEHDSGDFYPRWIQNFMDGLLNPVPNVSTLRKIPGEVPVGVKSHACISNPVPESGSPDQTAEAQVCFQDAEPRIASGVDFTRSVWFDNFAPFGAQQIARTLVDDLPANILVRGQITELEPLQQSDYPLLRAREFTDPAKQIATQLVSRSAAESLLEATQGQVAPDVVFGSDAPREGQSVVYIRTDRKGKVREAYRDAAGRVDPLDDAVIRALTLHFKPLVIDGAPRQMEAPIVLPS
jgi:hypothetical protein